MTTTEEVRKDIDANWEGVYAALQAVGRLDERVGRLEKDVKAIRETLKKHSEILERLDKRL